MKILVDVKDEKALFLIEILKGFSFVKKQRPLPNQEQKRLKVLKKPSIKST